VVHESDPSSAARLELLIVSSWAPPSVGGPENLYNIFSQLHVGTFAILTPFRNILATSKTAGSWLPCTYHFPDHAPIEAHDLDPEARTTILDQKEPRSWFARAWQAVKSRLQPIRPLQWVFFGFRFVLDTFQLLDEGRTLVAATRPRNILGISDSGAAMIASYRLAKRFGVPLHYYLFDLYAEGGFESPITRWVSRWTERPLLEAATSVLVTNAVTKEHYERRYAFLKNKITVVPNSIFPDPYEDSPSEVAPKAPYTIVFTGRVYWAQRRSLMNLISTMKLLKDRPIKLKLYVPFPDRPLRNAVAGLENVELLSAPHSEMPLVHRQADILFLPLSWRTRAPAIIATASPGKLTNYLLSGRPILVHAPPESFVSSYARKEDFAEVVDVEDPMELRLAILRLLENVEHSRRLIKNARRVFGVHHDARQTGRIVFDTLGIAHV
jgi:glycosyltransferase involved in cell wall biosynthesis